MHESLVVCWYRERYGISKNVIARVFSEAISSVQTQDFASLRLCTGNSNVCLPLNPPHGGGQALSPDGEGEGGGPVSGKMDILSHRKVIFTHSSCSSCTSWFTLLLPSLPTQRVDKDEFRKACRVSINTFH